MLALGPIGGFDDAGNPAAVLAIEWRHEITRASSVASYITCGSKANTPAHWASVSGASEPTAQDYGCTVWYNGGLRPRNADFRAPAQC